jgi:tetratricopeptide (TPR) repeat protein
MLWLGVLTTLSGAVRGNGEVETLIGRGDVFDRKLQPAEALSFYLAAEKLDPKNVPLMLRIARQYRHEAADAAAHEDKIRLSNTGKDYALRAVELAPNEAEAHLSVAISYAKMSLLLGAREKLEASRKVKAAVDRAISLDPHNDLAWHVLGCWHEQLAEVGPIKRAAARILYGEVPEGSSEEAVKCFLEAIKLNPNRLSHYIELGLVYARMGRRPEARECLKKGLAMANVDKGDPEVKERGRAALDKLP